MSPNLCLLTVALVRDGVVILPVSLVASLDTVKLSGGHKIRASGSWASHTILQFIGVSFLSS